MSLHLNIEHHTQLSFDDSVDYTIQQLHLTPLDGFGQKVKRWEIRVNGELRAHADTYGNLEHTLVVDGPHRSINITATGEVETGVDVPPQPDVLPIQVYLRYTPLTMADHRIRAFAKLYAPTTAKLDDAVLTNLMFGIRDCVAYRKGKGATSASAADALAAGEGSCHDYAHIFIACCRSLGIPARFVSGYLFSTATGRLESHAWADAWVEGEGWLSFDVCNGQRANGIHVRLATGLDYRDACPVSGVAHGATEAMSLSVQVQQAQQ